MMAVPTSQISVVPRGCLAQKQSDSTTQKVPLVQLGNRQREAGPPICTCPTEIFWDQSGEWSPNPTYALQVKKMNPGWARDHHSLPEPWWNTRGRSQLLSTIVCLENNQPRPSSSILPCSIACASVYTRTCHRVWKTQNWAGRSMTVLQMSVVTWHLHVQFLVLWLLGH